MSEEPEKQVLNLEQIKVGITALKELVELVEGKKDIKSRVQVIADPDNPKTMAYLNRGESFFCEVAHTITQAPKWGPMFDPLKSFATEKLQFNTSIGAGANKTL